MILFHLLACGGRCPEGFAVDAEGMCKSTDTSDDPEPEVATELAFSFDACVPGYSDGRVDLEAGCAEDVCVGMTYDEIVAIAGQPVDCTVYCEWASGLGVNFDQETAADIVLGEPYDGGTEDGLSVGASFQCFLDVLGDAEAYDLYLQDDATYAVWAASFGSGGLNVFDSDALHGEADGLVDSLWIEGLAG